MKLLVSLGLSAFTASAGAMEPLSPQQAAAGFATSLIAERDLAWMSGLMRAFAHQFSSDVIGKAGASAVTIAPCEFGGDVRIVRLPGLIKVFKADYRECVTRQDGFQHIARGQVELALTGVGSAQRLFWVRFGQFGQDFVWESQTYPEREPHVPPSSFMLDYWMAGDFQDRDAFGVPAFDDYDLLVNGTMSEHFYNLYSDGSLLENTSIVDADVLVVRGGKSQVVEDVGGEPHTWVVNTNEHGAGSLTYENYAPGSQVEYLLKERAFDDFKLVVAQNQNTNEMRRTVSGSMTVNKPVTATDGCFAGTFQFDTPQTLTGGAPEFTSGEVMVNAVAIRFGMGYPSVEITAPGYDPVSIHGGTSLLEYGNCDH
jgi:hypothetical protein